MYRDTFVNRRGTNLEADLDTGVGRHDLGAALPLAAAFDARRSVPIWRFRAGMLRAPKASVVALTLRPGERQKTEMPKGDMGTNKRRKAS